MDIKKNIHLIVENFYLLILYKVYIWGDSSSLKINHSIYSNFRGEFFVFGATEVEPPAVFPRIWNRQKFHYDNVGIACLTLFAVQTTEGWPV